MPQQEQSLSNDDYYNGLDVFLEYPREIEPFTATNADTFNSKFFENVHWQKGGILGTGSFGKVCSSL